jgi:cyanophycinase-like exopeptidase
MSQAQLGSIALFGSGETAPSSTKTHTRLSQLLGEPPRIAVFETPAGFEPNSAAVAGKTAENLKVRIQNFKPTVNVIAARKKGTAYSPDDPEIVDAVFDANWILLGPGSPTYAARQLRDTRGFHNIIARHRLGGTLTISSSATLAFSMQTMPVYEIYKVGEDLHWFPGLDFFSQFGIPLIVIPHWNNNDGGDELDTSRCYMGQERFGKLVEMLDPGYTILGIDEHTSVLLQPDQGHVDVYGAGNVYIVRNGDSRTVPSGETFPLTALGNWQIRPVEEVIPADVWETARKRVAARRQEQAADKRAPEEVLELVEARSQARADKAWQRADELRDEIEALGWQVLDTADGPQLEPLD